MSRIKGKETKLELLVFRELRKAKIHFKKHVKKVRGCPDVVRMKDRKAVFIDGDFWHGWKFEQRKSKLPPFWQEKIAKNIKRDRRNFRHLRKAGWKYLRVWEHDLEKAPEKSIRKILTFLRG